EVGCDVVDLAESIEYALRVQALQAPLVEAGIRVCSSCSSVSVVTATLVAATRIAAPEAVSVCLVPASAESPSAATARSLLDAVGRRVQVFRDGALVSDMGWSEGRRFWFPLGRGG